MCATKQVKPKYTFKDFLLGNDNLCSKCNTYVHRENYDYFSKICDNCGINAELEQRLNEVAKKIFTNGIPI